MKRLMMCLCAMLALVPCHALILVKDGIPASTIVTEDKPTRNAQFAALELQHHLRLITGCQIPILPLNSPQIKGSPIYVGVKKAATQADLKPETLTGEEYIAQITEQAIHLIGRDTQAFGKITYRKLSDLPPLRCDDHGTLWAVYEFLNRSCQVNWYAPGDNGIAFTPRKTLAVSPLTIRRRPFMKAFRMVYAPQFYRAQNDPYDPVDAHLLKLRWKNTERYAMGNHNVYSIWMKYYAPAKSPYWSKFFIEKRPEFFAQNYLGKSKSHLIALRQQYPDDPKLPPQLCNTNQEVIQLLAQEAADRLAGKDVVTNMGRNAKPTPGEPYYYPIQPDDNHGFCRCEKCMNLFKDKWKGNKRPDNYIHFDWTGKIAAEAARLNPNLGIVTLAYGPTREYPKGLDMPPNLSVMMVFGTGQCWHKMSNDVIEKDFKDWTQNEGGKRLLTAWLHFLPPEWDAKIVYKYNHVFPGFNRKNTGKWFQKFAAGGIQGVFMETPDEIGYPFWYRQLELTIASRMMDDTTLNPDQLADEFFKNYYGSAAKPMRRFYDIVENAYWNQDNFPGNKKSKFNTLGAFHSEDVNWGKAGTAQRMKQLEQALLEADQRANTDTVRQRLKLFRNGLWNSMKQGRKNWEEKEKYVNRPVPIQHTTTIPKAGGNLKRVDWTKATELKLTRTLDGFPARCQGTFHIALDGDYAYLRYQEKNPNLKVVTKDMWAGDHIEIFIASQPARPIYQLAFGTNGGNCRLGHFYKNDVAYSSEWDFGTTFHNAYKNGIWTATVAIPFKEFMVTDKPELRLNVFRIKANGRKACWSPIFHVAHNTPEKMGILRWK